MIMVLDSWIDGICRLAPSLDKGIRIILWVLMGILRSDSMWWCNKPRSQWENKYETMGTSIKLETMKIHETLMKIHYGGFNYPDLQFWCSKLIVWCLAVPFFLRLSHGYANDLS